MLSDPVWAQRVPDQAAGQQAVSQAQLEHGESGSSEQLADAVGGLPNRFVAFLKISARRAFRLRIQPSEVLPEEREALAAASPPIVDENLQAFLAWRRSVIFLVATILTVLSIMGLVDSLGGDKVPSSVRFVKLVPTLAEVAFCAICWLSLREWTHWRRQRKRLLLGWLLFMLAPFLVFVYPLDLGGSGATHGFAFALIALFELGPKVISLMPGLIRSATVIKLLFPGASAPAWFVVMCAPIYALIAYALLVIPYQLTGSGWFILGVILLVIAQGLVARSGLALAKPVTQDEALVQIRRVRRLYVVLIATSGVSIVVGLGMLASLLHLAWTTVAIMLLQFAGSVMILTTIGADLVMANLDLVRGSTEGKQPLAEETELQLATFIGLNALATETAPPTGPAQY